MAIIWVTDDGKLEQLAFGGDEKWLDFLYIMLQWDLPKIWILGVSENRVSDPNDFGPSTWKEKIAIIGNGKNEGGAVLNVSSGVKFWKCKYEISIDISWIVQQW